MLTSDALKYFGSKSAIAKAAGIELPSFYKWGTLVPEGRARRLEEASGGVLIYDKDVYDRYRHAKRLGKQNTCTTKKESD
ncbi:transcriptional regulator [Salmonella enterica subsp. enterica]|nr:transcriptional regulator [Salmonella enterica]EAW3939493.1 transcriptional regulator [Salmonella enterica subsp. enterica]EAW4187473.1 transcriptional regulator [Salmonella enterica subsp. enterica]EAW4265915.1 transcriptional regulator [Salmonella enterica subsp. enterica]EAW4270572.1 transcriptional regulator [Salmonella enterica subsp. enterica]